MILVRVALNNYSYCLISPSLMQSNHESYEWSPSAYTNWVMNRPISVRGFGPNLLGICTIRSLRDQTGKGKPPVCLVEASPFSLYM